MTAQQLALALDLPPALSRDDFLTGPANRAALEAIDAWPGWPGGVLLLTGPPGSGKSHLVQVWRAVSGAGEVAAAALAGSGLERLPPQRDLAVEDIDRADDIDRPLFHVLNRARERGGTVLLTARDPARAVTRTLPDLASRLRAARPVALEPPDDDLLSRVLVKLFADRQMAPPSDLVGYLLTRMERSFEVAARLVDALDRAALSSGRPLSRRLAATVLEDLRGAILPVPP